MIELTLANWKEWFVNTFVYKGEGCWLKKYEGYYDENDEWIEKELTGYAVPDSFKEFIQTLLDLQKEEMHRDFRETLDIIKHGCYMRGEKEAQEVIELHRTKYKG